MGEGTSLRQGALEAAQDEEEGLTDRELFRALRDEAYHAKRLVRATRNHTKTTAAALQDSEDRLDVLIAELDQRIPHAQGGTGTNGSADTARPAER